MDINNEEQIMLKIKAGKVELLALLFEKYHKQLFNYTYRFTGNRQLGEDLVQEIFCRILKYRNSYKGTSRFVHWLYKVARNTVFDHFRKNRETDIFEPEKHEEYETISPQDLLEKEEKRELLQKAISSLPEKKREILIMSRFQNLKYSEIADIMGCSVNTIKVQVHRSLKELQKYFAGGPTDGL